MSQRKQLKLSKKDQILRRFQNGEDEYSEGSENHEQHQLGTDPSRSGGASLDLYLDSSVDRFQEDHYSKDPFGYDNNRDDSRSRGIVGYDPMYDSSTSSMSYSDEPMSLVMHGGRYEDSYEEPSALVPSDLNPKKKREQKCSLCSNHHIKEPTKGHKHYCPYLKCDCSLCDVTRKRQYFMKEQQKMTRKQNQDRMCGTSMDTSQMNRDAPIAPPVRDREYPACRRIEMQEAVADLDMSSLDAVFELCKKGKKKRKGGQ